MSARSDCPAVDLWPTLFGRWAPVDVEIGSGDGALLLAYAARHPERNFLGIERAPAKFRRLEARLAHAGSVNVRLLRADVTCVVPALVPPASVATYHVYFPDPWPKRGHAFRRIFSPPFIAALARTLAPRGRLFLATDVHEYAVDIRSAMLDHGDFSEHVGEPEHPGLQTSFARKYRAAGRPLYATTFARVDAAARRVQPAAASKIKSM